MDKRVTHRPTSTRDAHSTVLVEARDPAGGLPIDGAGPPDTLDLTSLLQAIAARIDVVLTEKVAAGNEPAGSRRAVRAWSSVVGKRATDATSDLRRHALATTVLRISADGRVDLDDRQQGIADDDAETEAECQQGPDREDDAARSGAKAVGAAKPAQAVVVSVSDVTPESPSPPATDRSDVEERLRAVRKRLAARHASASSSRVDPPSPRASRIRPQGWRGTEIRALVQRLLIGLAVVGASAVVSILVT